MEANLIEYLKSSISISSYSGCTINCKYCILSSLKNRLDVVKVFDEEQLVEDLFQNKFFVKDFTPVTINNRTDPFLNKIVKESTFKILDCFEKKNIKNPLIIITKGYLNEDDICKLKTYSCNLHIFYTYSGISETLENRVEKIQIKTMERLASLNNIKLVHYYRPIIEGINTSDEIINHVSQIATKFFNTSVVSGVRINSHLKNVFKNENLKFLLQPDSEHKIILEETYNKIKDTLLKYNDNHLCFKKTSCCISVLNNQVDYNSNFYTEKKCSKDCINYNLCHKSKGTTNDEFKKLLENIDKNYAFEIKDSEIIVHGELDQEEKIYLVHNSKMKIRPTKLKKCSSEELLSK